MERKNETDSLYLCVHLFNLFFENRYCVGYSTDIAAIKFTIQVHFFKHFYQKTEDNEDSPEFSPIFHLIHNFMHL